MAFQDVGNCRDFKQSKKDFWNAENDEDCNNSHHDIGHADFCVTAIGDGSLCADDNPVVEDAEDDDGDKACCSEGMENLRDDDKLDVGPPVVLEDSLYEINSGYTTNLITLEIGLFEYASFSKIK